MIGVAAEVEFSRLLDVATKSKHGAEFTTAAAAPFVGTRIALFQKAIEKIKKSLPRDAVENISLFGAIQDVIRRARNDAGHPVVTTQTREEVYVYLQLFVQLAKQIMVLRQSLS